MELLEEHWDYSVIARNDDVLCLLAEHQPPAYFTAGSKFSYSNTAYMCLASVIEKASGLSYSEYMRRFVFEPAGMHDSYQISRRLHPELTTNNYAFGYIRMNEQQLVLPDNLPELQFVHYLDGIQGDGTIHATALDLLRLDRALSEGCFAELQTEQLRASNKSNEVTDAVEYAEAGNDDGRVVGGWFLHHHPAFGRILSHSGGWPGYSTRMCRYIDSGYTMIILCNVEPLDFRNRSEGPEDWQQQIEQLLLSKT